MINSGELAYIELYVAYGPLVVDYFCEAFAFTATAVSHGPNRESTLLCDGSIRLVITAPTGPGEVADYVMAHGDAVRDIALARRDLPDVMQRAARAGLTAQLLPRSGPGPTRVRVDGFGVLQHTLISAPTPSGMPPGFDWTPLPPSGEQAALGQWPLLEVDHIAVCLPTGSLQPTAETYASVFGMEVSEDDSGYVAVGETGMDSRVLRGGGVTYVMAEPDPAMLPGQIDDFLDVHGAAGVQHIAFRCDDLIAAVRGYTQRGVQFVAPPPVTYYQALADRLGDHPALQTQLADLRETGVLVDADHDGLLYQIFTKTPHASDALFYELVQRSGGADGFGTANVIALFQAREADLRATSSASS